MHNEQQQIPATLMTVDAARELAAKLKADDPEWDYSVLTTGVREGFAYVEVYDEFESYVGTL